MPGMNAAFRKMQRFRKAAMTLNTLLMRPKPIQIAMQKRCPKTLHLQPCLQQNRAESPH